MDGWGNSIFDRMRSTELAWAINCEKAGSMTASVLGGVGRQWDHNLNNHFLFLENCVMVINHAA